eukprot:SAG22_NODE_304_length_12712_cov_10.515421_9_plen_52_part_01
MLETGAVELRGCVQCKTGNPDGGMRLAKGQEQAWMIRLRSIQIPTTIQRVED